jgi:hypothetical protein
MSEVKCIVDFCRKGCPILPEDAEVFRASGEAQCEICGCALRLHQEFAYPTGQGHCIKSCNGKYYHL